MVTQIADICQSPTHISLPVDRTVAHIHGQTLNQGVNPNRLLFS